MYQRIGSAAYKKTLDNITLLCDALDNPHLKFKNIHVAGTNGKGSVSHMLASIFHEAGYSTGLYTSPHLKDFRERIKINGEKISRFRVSSFVTSNKNLFKKIKPSFFEMTVAMAFDYFAKKKVDIAIIETGLGGRLDSTNIIKPELSIITNVSKDHTTLLGNSIKNIAEEKAGIIKVNTPLVLGDYSKEYYPLIKDKCKKLNAPLFIASKKYLSKKLPSKNKALQKIKIKNRITKKSNIISTDLLGDYQMQNICTVLKSTEILKKKFEISDKNIISGLMHVIKNTGLQGRWQILNKKPLCICDTGHNADAINKIVQQINTIPYKNLHFVFGVVKDKTLTDILKYLPKSAIYYFCKANVPRGLDEKLLKKIASGFKLKGESYSSVDKAFHAAKKYANKQDLIFIGGSAFVCSEII